MSDYPSRPNQPYTSAALQPRPLRRPAPGSGVAVLVLYLVVAAVQALLVFHYGWMALAGVLLVTAVLAAPALRDPFSLLRIFIITWPILTYYVFVPLPAGIPDVRYERLFALLLLAIVVVQNLLSRAGFVLPTATGVLVLIYALAELYGRVILPFAPDSTLKLLLDYSNSIALPLVAYWLVRNLVHSRSRLLAWMTTLTIAGVVVAVTGLYDYWVGQGGTDILPGGQPWAELELESGDEPGLRAAGALTNAGQLGAFTGMGLVAALGALSHAESRVSRWLLWAAVPVLAAAAFFSLTRGAWLAVVVTLLLVQFLLPGTWKKVLPVLWIGTVGLIVLWERVASSTIYQNRVLDTGTIETRGELARLGWGLIQQKPLFGWGAGAFDTLSRGIVGTSSHNIFLTFLVDGGVVLLGAFLATIAVVGIRAASAFVRYPAGSMERTGLSVGIGILITYLLKGMSGGYHSADYLTAMFWMAAALVENLALAAPQRSQSPRLPSERSLPS